MGLKLSNNGVSSLAAAITSGATTLSIQGADAGKFPILGAGDWCPATIVDSANNMEIVRITARAAATLTIVRAQEGTTAKAFAAGSRIDVRLTAGSIGGMASQNAGNVAITGGSIEGIIDLAVEDGGTGASTPEDARANLGLGDVDNTSDAEKPVSTAQQTEIDKKVSKAGGTMTGQLALSFATPSVKFTDTVDAKVSRLLASSGFTGFTGNDGNWTFRVDVLTGTLWTKELGDLNSRIEARGAAYRDAALAGVPAKIATQTAGSVGSYMFANYYNGTSNTPALNPGDILPGSQIYASGDNTSIRGAQQTGTWRCMGQGTAYNSEAWRGTNLFLRVS